MIKLEHFSKSYSSKSLKSSFFSAGSSEPAGFCVDDVCFTAASCQITGLLGLNGAGKSTVLKAVCAFFYPTSGKIFISPDDNMENALDTEKNASEIKKLIGYMPEEPLVDKALTVFEAFKFHAEAMEIKNAGRLKETAQLFELPEIFTKKVKILSKGERQRLSLALALVHNPPVLVLDEPTSALDVMQAHKIRYILKKLSAEKTIFISSHNMSEVEQLCSKIGILINGKLVCQGSQKEILEFTGEKTLEQAFIKLKGNSKKLQFQEKNQRLL